MLLCARTCTRPVVCTPHAHLHLPSRPSALATPRVLSAERGASPCRRFPNGESGADVYDRLTIFEDHLTRDMFMGRFADTNLVLVTHGLTLRIFLMRW